MASHFDASAALKLRAGLVMARVALLSVVLSGCCTTVVIPSGPALDQAPTITLDAFPIVPPGPAGAGDISEQNRSASGFVKVSRGKTYMMSATAVNSAGGVQVLTMTVVQGGRQIHSTTVTEERRSDGKACTSLSLFGGGEKHSDPINITMTEHATVTVTATNFNGMTTSIVVTYVPVDLEVVLTATPTIIGYQQSAPSATLNWSFLYGVPPYTATLSPMPPGLTGSLANTTSISVNPAATTTYILTVQDQTTTKSATATVSVVKPPPPPKVSFKATPNNGYNCLGVVNTLTWSVTQCPSSSCEITLKGTGTGYAQDLNVFFPHLQPTGTYKLTPSDIVNFTLTATSPGGSATEHAQMAISPPATCSPAIAPDVNDYYFVVHGPEFCGEISVPADTEAHAEEIAQANYGSEYTLTAITKDEFGHSCN